MWATWRVPQLGRSKVLFIQLWDTGPGCRWKDKAMTKEEMEKMKGKKMRIMYNQDLEMKDYVKEGTLYW